MEVPLRKIVWAKTWRVIPTRYPKRELYERIVPRSDFKAVEEIEQLTNSRIRFIQGEIHCLRPQDHLPKNTPRHLMAPFTKPRRGRFSDTTIGCYYTADALATAIKEKIYHDVRFLKATQEPPMRLDMMVLVCKLAGELHDLRGQKRSRPQIYALNDYKDSVALGRALWTEGSAGILYDSVRRLDSTCAAVFSPQCLSHVREDRCLIFEWDGKHIVPFELHEFPSL